MAFSIASVTSTLLSSYGGKSISYNSFFFFTDSLPLRIENSISERSGSTKFIRTKAVANVAWPHKSISPPGVNHRSFQPLFSFTTKAVSDRRFSEAMSCINFSSGQRSGRQIAAGFPWKTLSVKASAMNCLIIFASFS